MTKFSPLKTQDSELQELALKARKIQERLAVILTEINQAQAELAAC